MLNPVAMPVPQEMHTISSVTESEACVLERIRSKQAKIAVVGMGHVGLPTALGLASQGWSVIGADSSLPLISLLQAGKAPFYEPGIEDMLLEFVGKRFFPVDNLSEAIREATIVFLCVGPHRNLQERQISLRLKQLPEPSRRI